MCGMKKESLFWFTVFTLGLCVSCGADGGEAFTKVSADGSSGVEDGSTSDVVSSGKLPLGATGCIEDQQCETVPGEVNHCHHEEGAGYCTFWCKDELSQKACDEHGGSCVTLSDGNDWCLP